MAITVVNKKHSPFDIYIGRGSKWGNPFKIGADGTRADVVKKYEEYLRNNKTLLKALPELEDKTLGCFCAPLACHGDVLKLLFEEQKEPKS